MVEKVVRGGIYIVGGVEDGECRQMKGWFEIYFVRYELYKGSGIDEEGVMMMINNDEI